jgi:hypothetical protein
MNPNILPVENLNKKIEKANNSHEQAFLIKRWFIHSPDKITYNIFSEQHPTPIGGVRMVQQLIDVTGASTFNLARKKLIKQYGSIVQLGDF